MQYPKYNDLQSLLYKIKEWADLKAEYGAPEQANTVIESCRKAMKDTIATLQALPEEPEMKAKEPDDLKQILALRPQAGPQVLWESFDETLYRNKLQGALLGRFAGCTLGVPVEGWSVEAMEGFAKHIGMDFPPTDYWTDVSSPHVKQYAYNSRTDFMKNNIQGVPVDDDIIYTLLGLLIVEQYGHNFTTADVGQAWKKYLPYACTAEEIALNNLKAGVPAEQAAEKDNPYVQFIGADIRSDPFAYVCPGLPEKAARLAYHDAYLSHRRNGIYGEMFFAAAQSAAFATKTTAQALEIGLSQIPAECALAKDIRWALENAGKYTDYKQARAAVDQRFEGMHIVHTNNNACLTVFGLLMGGDDYTKVISNIVAMGLDNDCTAATAGSIIGAVVGKEGIPSHWTENFNNKVHSYLIGLPEFKLDDLYNRFTAQAKKAFQ